MYGLLHIPLGIVCDVDPDGTVYGAYDTKAEAEDFLVLGCGSNPNLRVVPLPLVPEVAHEAAPDATHPHQLGVDTMDTQDMNTCREIAACNAEHYAREYAEKAWHYLFEALYTQPSAPIRVFIEFEASHNQLNAARESALARMYLTNLLGTGTDEEREVAYDLEQA